jgi:hypothetical protein
MKRSDKNLFYRCSRVGLFQLASGIYTNRLLLLHPMQNDWLKT